MTRHLVGEQSFWGSLWDDSLTEFEAHDKKGGADPEANEEPPKDPSVCTKRAFHRLLLCRSKHNCE